jgi:hypothetical protein
MRVGLQGLALVLGCAWFGCQHAPSSKDEPEGPQGPVAVLNGQVRLAPGAKLPRYAALDLARKPLRASPGGEIPGACQSANQAAREPVTLTATGLLAGVLVAASDFTRVRERHRKVHQVVIENCRLKPSLIAAAGGDTLSIENRDAFAFEPLLGPAYEGLPLPRGKKVKIPLYPGGIDSIMCSPGAPCGRTDLVVFFHPVSTVTGTAGTFQIKNFPASELVRVSAWHPLFEESETTVWLEPGTQTTVDLVLTPKPRFVP